MKTPLKFNIGDAVIYTNDYGVKFHFRIVGFYKDDKPDWLYAQGYRYYVNSNSPWMPVKESSLKPDEGYTNCEMHF
jgi:hypothetical protein